MSDAKPKARWLLALLEQHEAPLIRYAARLVGDVERARDLVQETFFKLWKAGPGELQGDAHAAAWLYTVCRNLAFDHHRKERRMDAFTSEQAHLGARAAGSEQDGSSAVLALLSELPPSQQEVIRLKFQDGLSYKDIAQVTGHSVSHVGVLIHNGIKTLRHKMQNGGQA